MEQAIHFERVLRYGILLRQEDTAAAHFRQEIALFNKLNKNVEEELHKGEALAEEALVKAYSEESKKEFQHVDQSLKRIEKEYAGFE